MSASPPELEFGPLETVPLVRRLRPDGDCRYAVLPRGVPIAEDLPVFVAWDTLRDLESHALSDIRVELGGLLLGESCEDDRDRPFVVIAHSLPARHYESTCDSFKFTHETWMDLTRRRTALPADLQVVGWYHTHPHLGVFLSEPDCFICEHFFRRPSDVALVIDPCRQDWGFFQWTGGPGPPQRTGGFFVFAPQDRTGDLNCQIV